MLSCNPETFCKVNVIVPALLFATFKIYGVFKLTNVWAGSNVLPINDQKILGGVAGDTQIAQPLEFISLYISPSNARHVPLPPVTLKLTLISQSAREAISGKSYSDNVGIVTAPLVV